MFQTRELAFRSVGTIIWREDATSGSAKMSISEENNTFHAEEVTLGYKREKNTKNTDRSVSRNNCRVIPPKWPSRLILLLFPDPSTLPESVAELDKHIRRLSWTEDANYLKIKNLCDRDRPEENHKWEK